MLEFAALRNVKWILQAVLEKTELCLLNLRDYVRLDGKGTRY